MGTTIRATCPTCGDIELAVADLKALVCMTDDAASYCFRCPLCRILVSKPTSRQVVDVLVSSGVRLHVWSLPAELEEVHNGPPLAPSDVVSLRLELTRTDWYERLVESGAGGGAM